MTEEQIKTVRAVHHGLAATEDLARLLVVGMENLSSDQQNAWGASAFEVIAERLSGLWNRLEEVLP